MYFFSLLHYLFHQITWLSIRRSTFLLYLLKINLILYDYTSLPLLITLYLFFTNDCGNQKEKIGKEQKICVRLIFYLIIFFLQNFEIPFQCLRTNILEFLKIHSLFNSCNYVKKQEILYTLRRL